MVGTAQTSRPASRQHRTPCPGCGHDGTRKNSGSNVSHLDPDPAKGIADRRCRLCTVIRECASVLGASGILEVRGDELVMEELVDGEAMAFAVKLSNRQGSKHPIPNLPFAPDPKGAATLEQSLQQAHAWLAHCVASHPECREPDPSLPTPTYPTRLLDVSSSTSVLLVETAKTVSLFLASSETPLKRLKRAPTLLSRIAAPRKRLFGGERSVAQVRPPYAALSHCWGTSQPIRTLRSNVEAHMGRKPFLAPSSTLTPHVAECADNVAIRRRSSISSISSSLASSLTINSSTPSSPGIPVSSLPRTFRDAVTATRALGLRYLWIDSLCIVQDDPEDWAREAGRMAGVYGGAHVVIAANRAGGCEEGFLPPVPETSSMRTSPESPWSPRYPTSPRRLSRMNMAQRWLGSAGGRAVVGDDNGDADGVEMSDSRGPSRRFEGLIYIPWEGGEQGEDGNDESEVATPFVYRRVLHSHRHSVLRTPSSLSGSSGGIGGTPGQMLAEQASSEGPLARRAWAFQERLLARRFLAFGEHEMRFECVAGLRCECRGRPTELPGLHRHNLGFFLAERRDSLRQDWRSIIVPLYTRRRLTRWEDRLVAVSAVAEAWGRAMEQEEKSREAESGGQQGSHVESQYLAGLWRSDLVAGLAWYNVGSPMPYVTRSNDRKGTVAPSWSWASIHGMAEYVPTWDRPSGLGDALLLSSSSLGSQVSTGPSAPRLAEVVDVSYTLSRLSTNRYGDCESASVTLKGRFGQATARPVTRSQGECDAGGGRTGPVITGYELAFAGSSTFFGDRVSHWVVPRAGNWIRFDALMDVVDVRVEAEGAKDVFRIVRTAAQRRQAWQDVTFSLPREHTAAEETSSMTRLPGATELSGETALSDVTTLPGATLSGATLDGEYPVWCLCLESQSDWDNNGRHTFLILGHSKDKPHAYERLGIAILHDLSVEESEQVERFLEERTVVKTVSIV